MKQDSLIYQILPASFDHDISGITRHLDYIADLGVTHIWINPFYPSGGKDNGYDPIDQRKIDSVFGRMEDFDLLIKEAAKRNIGVIVDLVSGHVSDHHPWFQEASSSRDNPKHDYFVWRDSDLRNNWLSMFGGNQGLPAWTRDEKTRQDYLHHFFPQQPTLNLRHPEVVADILETVQFWKDRGVAGFRVDAVDHLFHDDQFRDNPIITDDLSVKPFKRQKHLHDIMQMDETLNFLRAVRKTAGDYALLIAEVSSQQSPLSAAQRIGLYTTEGKFDSAYTLGLVREKDLRPAMFSKMYEDAAPAGSGKPGRICWATQCHDESRREHSAEMAEFYWYLSMIMPGDKCIYYGEERGQANDRTLINVDPNGRGPARGKISWGSELEEQTLASESYLNRFRQAAAFWKENRELLSNGAVEVRAIGDTLHVTRNNAEKSIQLIFNASDHSAQLPIQDLPIFYDVKAMVTPVYREADKSNDSHIIVPPYGIIKLEGPPLPSVPPFDQVRAAPYLEKALSPV